MGNKPSCGFPSRRMEKQLIKMAGEALRANCRNAERIGCPGPAAVGAVVRRRLEYPSFDDIVDHIATCAPCFEEYNRQRRRQRLRNAGLLLLSCVGLLALGLLWRHGPAERPYPRESAAKQSPSPALTATLDYRNWHEAQQSGDKNAGENRGRKSPNGE